MLRGLLSWKADDPLQNETKRSKARCHAINESINFTRTSTDVLMRAKSGCTGNDDKPMSVCRLLTLLTYVLSCLRIIKTKSNTRDGRIVQEKKRKGEILLIGNTTVRYAKEEM